MNLKRTAAPADDPISLAEAKKHLRVTHTAEDDYITDLIMVARMACEDRIQQTLVCTPWRLTLDAFSTKVVLPMGPVLEMLSIQYVDVDGVTQTLVLADSQLASQNDIYFLVPAVQKQWPATQAGRYGAVWVDYKAGFGVAAADVPTPLRRWMLLAIGDMYANRERSSDRPVVPQQFADGLLDAYRERPI